jgi:hypothetical protein
LAWITGKLKELEINFLDLEGGALLADGSRLHVKAYEQLRDIVRSHMMENKLPILSQSTKPAGGYKRIEAQGGYVADLIQANARITQEQTTEGISTRDLELAEDWQDNAFDNDWVRADGIIDNV